MTRMREAAEYLLYQILFWPFLLLPRRVCLGLGEALGLLLFHLDARHRRIALHNLDTAFGAEFPAGRRYGIARASFLNFGRTLVDILKLSSWPRERIERLIAVEGEDNLRQALAGSRGALVFTAHFGNWELTAIPMSNVAPFWAVTRFLDNPFLEKRLFRFRSRLGGRIIYKHQAARQVLQGLRRNDIVIILIDQNVLRYQAVFVDYFGRLAGTTPSLAAFHLRSGAPIVPMFCDRAPRARYRVRFFPPIKVRAETSRERAVLKITQTCTKIIESEVRRRPELWLWFHERWKSRPQGESPLPPQTDET